MKTEETKEYCESSDGIEVECCPTCGEEITLEWSINMCGFKAICPSCGNRLMLCDACQHRFGDLVCDCDYDRKTDSCRFNRKV